MKKTKKGFTLVELVIVVAVMAVLVAVAIPTVSAITNTAKESVEKTNAQTIESMIKLEKAKLANSSAGTNTWATGASADNSTKIDDALTAAALGIEEGTYIYNDSKGTCRVSTTSDAGSAGEYIITFDGDNASGDYVSVNKKS